VKVVVMIRRAKKSGPPTFEEISRRAYEIFVQRGRPNGQDLEHWLQAEAELKSASSTVSGVKTISRLRREGARGKRTGLSSTKTVRREPNLRRSNP
jgi:hypothetical protein